MDTFFRHFVHQSLAFHLHENAIFLSERLFAESPSIPHLLLVAQTYYESGQYNIAYNLLKFHSSKWDVPFRNLSSSDPEATKSFFDFMDPQESIFYLFSLCCIKLEHYIDAEQYLRKCHEHNENNSIINYWLGIVYKLTCRKELAIQHFLKSVSICPMMWTAYQELAQLGYDRVETDGLFDPKKASLVYERFSHMYSHLSSSGTNPSSMVSTTFLNTHSAPKQTTLEIPKQETFSTSLNTNSAVTSHNTDMTNNDQAFMTFSYDTSSSTPNKPKLYVFYDCDS